MGDLPEFLSRTPFFGGVPRETLERLAPSLVEQAHAKGALVFSEGEPARSMFVVRDGELSASAGGVALARYGEGDFFGETALIDPAPRPSTVRVERDAHLWEITSMDLYGLYRSDARTYVLVLQNINRELCRRLRAAGDRLLTYGADLPGAAPRIPRH